MNYFLQLHALYDRADLSVTVDSHAEYMRYFLFNVYQNIYYFLDLYIAKFQSIYANMPNQIAYVAFYNSLNISDDTVQNYLDSVYALFDNDGNTALTFMANFQDHLKYIGDYTSVVDGTSAELFTNVRVTLSPQLDHCNYYFGGPYLVSLSKAFTAVYNCFLNFNTLFVQYYIGLDALIIPLITAVDTFNVQLYSCVWNNAYGTKVQCLQYVVSTVSRGVFAQFSSLSFFSNYFMNSLFLPNFGRQLVWHFNIRP